jgi:hypothetical protein
VIATRPGYTLMLASSQGDSSFHFYGIRHDAARHLGSFLAAIRSDCSWFRTEKRLSPRIPATSTATSSMGRRSANSSISPLR